MTSSDGLLASLSDSHPNPLFSEDNSAIFSSDTPDLETSLSNDNGELAVKDCSLISPQSRRARKRTAECDAGTLDNPGNPTVELPTTNSILDFSQEALKKKWCSETTSLVFGNIPVCATVALENPITKFFENVEGYLSKYIFYAIEINLLPVKIMD